ncbi:MAG: hypothetical protein DRH93_12350 [Deltaproteobacteria bacterium]|nr:MAG: hypothetical protein DRH93_12350 [Deltaproteobacteria bacterium]
MDLPVTDKFPIMNKTLSSPHTHLFKKIYFATIVDRVEMLKNILISRFFYSKDHQTCTQTCTHSAFSHKKRPSRNP